MRRILIIVAVLIVLLAAGLAAYFLYFRDADGILVGENPFGQAGGRDPGTVTPVVDTGIATPGAGTSYGERLLKLAAGPVARGTVSLYYPPQFAAPEASSTASTSGRVLAVKEEVEVRYIERQSGNVYAFRIHERTVTRLSNKTLPGIEDASWTPDGGRAFVRFLEEDGAGAERISTYLLPSNGEGGYFLEQNLSQVRAASSSVLTLLSSGSGSVASLMNADGSGARAVFSSALSSLRVAFSGSGYLAHTKASSYLDGYAFLVDRAGVFTRILGPLRGLSALPSPAGTSVLYSYSDRGKIYTQVMDTASRASTPLPLSTLPEKCVWTKDDRTLYCGIPTALTGILPDEWYQGARSFSDRIWKIDLASRVATLVFDPRQLADTQIDAQALSLDSENDVLVFMNRADGSLWSYDL